MIKNWIACVQDRGKWKGVIEKAKTFTRKFSAWKKRNTQNLHILKSYLFPIEFIAIHWCVVQFGVL
jgi:hypothetical protein